MRFRLALQALENKAFLPFNYQYPLSAAIYKIIQRADPIIARFLQDDGYPPGGRHFKLFTFSDIRTPFDRYGDRMLLRTGAAELIICFYMPQAAVAFVRGLFKHQQIEIADTKSKVTFTVDSVESLAEAESDGKMVLQPLSPIVSGRKNDRGYYDYYSPEEPGFVDCLVINWLEKWSAVHKTDTTSILELQKRVSVKVQLFSHPPQQRLVTIKGGTAAETKVRGYTKFRLVVQAPATLLELAFNAGLGLYNAHGFGCMAMVSEPVWKG